MDNSERQPALDGLEPALTDVTQDLLFDGDFSPMPEDVGFRGPVACSAAGITYRQLDYSARTGLVEPSVRSATGSGTQRLYGFRDILVLQIVKRLLDTGISLQNIRLAVDSLRNRGVNDMAEITLVSDGTTVYECRSAEEVIDLLGEWGYTPDPQPLEDGTAVDVHLRACPFIDLARTHPDVVCGVHRGLLRGALTAVGEPGTRVSLEPFVGPDLCRARLYLTDDQRRASS